MPWLRFRPASTNLASSAAKQRGWDTDRLMPCRLPAEAAPPHQVIRQKTTAPPTTHDLGIGGFGFHDHVECTPGS
jgi:hypothetical protein